MAGLCFSAIAIKLWLIRLININWDEFHYLEHVYAVRNGIPVPMFQTFHARLFAWLPFVSANEGGQIILVRYVMMAGLLATIFMLWRLARIWVVGWAAWMAPLAYLLAFPVFRHGAAFRTDSMLAPLLTGAVLLLCLDRSRLRLWVSALLCGMSLAISIKTVLAAPMLLAILMLSDRAESPLALAERVRHTLVFAGITAIVAALCLGVHYLFLAPNEAPPLDLVNRAASMTIIRQSWFPRWYEFLDTWWVDRTLWLLMAVGLVVALVKRWFVAASFALSFLPLLFYRNAFPYYYVVILTPTAVLATIGVSWIFDAFGRWRNFRLSAVVLWVAFFLLLVAKLSTISRWLGNDWVSHQLAIVDAVHEIFPEPVPYIDHSGMIASFPKSNSFMSTWGITEYRAAGVPFTERSMRLMRAPLLVANRGVFDPASKMHGWLLPEDRMALRGYIPWWGVVRVAGAEAEVCAGGAPGVLKLPFPGDYRVISDAPVLVDGQPVSSGSVLRLEATVSISDPDDPECRSPGGRRATLVDARVVGRPAGQPPVLPVYNGL